VPERQVAIMRRSCTGSLAPCPRHRGLPPAPGSGGEGQRTTPVVGRQTRLAGHSTPRAAQLGRLQPERVPASWPSPFVGPGWTDVVRAIDHHQARAGRDGQVVDGVLIFAIGQWAGCQEQRRRAMLFLVRVARVQSSMLNLAHCFGCGITRPHDGDVMPEPISRGEVPVLPRAATRATGFRCESCQSSAAALGAARLWGPCDESCQHSGVRLNPPPPSAGGERCGALRADGRTGVRPRGPAGTRG
jgi:hypothetical protein